MTVGSVVLVGRANVGKSTLFNRLTKTEQAIVANFAGMTRDRLYGTVPYFESEKNPDGEASYSLVDTGGLIADVESKSQRKLPTGSLSEQDSLRSASWRLTEAAILEADVVVFVVDGRTGLHPDDTELYRRLLRLNKPVITAINKIESRQQEPALLDFYRLGLEEYFPISAAHNQGMEELREAIEKPLLPLLEAHREQAKDWGDATKLAIIGRPNAGKSSFLNRLLGEERALVSEVAGTTRDPLDCPLRYDGHTYQIVDTAGIRRRTKIELVAEKLSIMRSLKVLDESHIIILLIDAVEGLTDQDARLANLAIDRCKPLIIVVNKWDLVPNKNTATMKEWELDFREQLGNMSFLPICFMSCLTNQRVHKVLATVAAAREQFEKRIETARTNQVLQTIIEDHTPVLIRARGKRLKFYFATQVSAKPPTFVIKCNFSDDLVESYRRYLKSRFQKELGFTMIPIRFLFRGKDQKSPKSRSKRPSLEVDRTLPPPPIVDRPTEYSP